MADDCDKAQDRMEREEQLRRMFQPKDEILPTGFCAYCAEPIQLPKKFCNSECAEDWEFERRMKGVR